MSFGDPTVGEMIAYLVIALVCGLVGQALAGRSIGGFILSTVVGLVGAVLGTWLARHFDAPEILAVSVGGKSIPIVWAILGAAVVAVVVAGVQRSQARARG